MEDEIEHLSHKHRLLLKKSYLDFRRTRAACGNNIYGDVYCCYHCQYNLHKSCAELEDEIVHLRHPFQSLKLHGIADDGAFDCNVCRTRCLGCTYPCTDCDFKMEVLCAREAKIRLPIHDHKLKLQVSDTDTQPSFFCDFCHTRCYSHRGRSLHCEEDCNFKIDLDCARMLINQCSFKLDANCASLKPPIKYEGHRHLLTFFEKVYDDPQCEVCKTSYSDVSYLRCVECDFNVHLYCLPLPSTIKHKCHIHPLHLRDYFVEDYSGEYYCDACENSRDPRESVYHCAGCSNYVAHISCVIDEELDGQLLEVLLDNANSAMSLFA
ncbi:uncharacterized protein LOC142616699 [Castanea sativa]|uniref:uncharacterized protein LOC142616699 n=1 Tax=Castanea sativa TaxID=21020 RepID=UPI003F64F56F